MPILLIVLITASCVRVSWPPPPFDLGGEFSIKLMMLTVMTSLFASAFLSRWVVHSLRQIERRPQVAARYHQIRRWLAFANIGATTFLVVGGGWGWTIWQSFQIQTLTSETHLLPYAEFLVPLPYFIMLIGGWLNYFPAERALFRTSHEAHAYNYWSLPGYMIFHIRQFAMLILFPVGLFVTQQSIARVAPWLVETSIYQILSIVFGVLLFLFIPRIAKPVLGLKSLPEGPIRERLLATTRRLDVRYTDLLIWPTRGAVANAMVIGVVPWARYIIFTDRILDNLPPDELDAVFGHEVGHVAHMHIPYYAGFISLSMVTITAAFTALDRLRVSWGWIVPEDYSGLLILPPALFMIAYLFIIFGFISRHCERQSDIYGCRAGSCRDSWCLGHDTDTERAENDKFICRTGVLALVRALDHVAVLNGADGSSTPTGFRLRIWSKIKAWQHGTISERIDFLQRLRDDPTLGDRHDRQSLFLRIGMIAMLLALFIMLGQYIGWTELWYGL